MLSKLLILPGFCSQFSPHSQYGVLHHNRGLKKFQQWIIYPTCNNSFFASQYKDAFSSKSTSLHCPFVFPVALFTWAAIICEWQITAGFLQTTTNMYPWQIRGSSLATNHLKGSLQHAVLIRIMIDFSFSIWSSTSTVTHTVHLYSTQIWEYKNHSLTSFDMLTYFPHIRNPL